MNATYKKMVKMAMTTVMAGGIMMMGQSAMAAPAQPQVHVDSATKDMPGHVASKVLDVKADKTEVGLISNVVYEQVPSRGYANVPMQMDILQPKTKEKKPAILFVTGGGFINANKDNGIQLRMHLAENGGRNCRCRGRMSRRPSATSRRMPTASASIRRASALSAAVQAAT